MHINISANFHKYFRNEQKTVEKIYKANFFQKFILRIFFVVNLMARITQKYNKINCKFFHYLIFLLKIFAHNLWTYKRKNVQNYFYNYRMLKSFEKFTNLEETNKIQHIPKIQQIPKIQFAFSKFFKCRLSEILWKSVFFSPPFFQKEQSWQAFSRFCDIFAHIKTKEKY